MYHRFKILIQNVNLWHDLLENLYVSNPDWRASLKPVFLAWLGLRPTAVVCASLCMLAQSLFLHFYISFNHMISTNFLQGTKFGLSSFSYPPKNLSEKTFSLYRFFESMRTGLLGSLSLAGSQNYWNWTSWTFTHSANKAVNKKNEQGYLPALGLFS